MSVVALSLGGSAAGPLPRTPGGTSMNDTQITLAGWIGGEVTLR